VWWHWRGEDVHLSDSPGICDLRLEEGGSPPLLNQV